MWMYIYIYIYIYMYVCIYIYIYILCIVKATPKHPHKYQIMQLHISLHGDQTQGKTLSSQFRKTKPTWKQEDYEALLCARLAQEAPDPASIQIKSREKIPFFLKKLIWENRTSYAESTNAKHSIRARACQTPDYANIASKEEVTEKISSIFCHAGSQQYAAETDISQSSLKKEWHDFVPWVARYRMAWRAQHSTNILEEIAIFCHAGSQQHAAETISRSPPNFHNNLQKH